MRHHDTERGCRVNDGGPHFPGCGCDDEHEPTLGDLADELRDADGLEVDDRGGWRRVEEHDRGASLRLAVTKVFRRPREHPFLIAVLALALVAAGASVGGIIVSARSSAPTTTSAPRSVEDALNGAGPLKTGAGATLASAAPGACTRVGYSRAKFGNHPSSADRDAILLLQRGPTGLVRDPYTGKDHPDTKGMDLDHVVPLGWAWDHGACHWPTQLRIMLATDPHNLVFTDASLNRSKGDSGPASWRPPVDPCGYWTKFTQLATDYRLQLDPVGADGHKEACGG